MVSFTRRTILQTGCTLGSAGLAGCTGILGQSSSTAPQLGELKAINFDSHPHTIDVHIDVEGEAVYQESKRLEAAPSDDAVSVYFNDYPTEPAPYVVYAWKDDQSRADAQVIRFSQFDVDCLGLSIQIGKYGTDLPDPHLSIYHTTNPNVCSPDADS